MNKLFLLLKWDGEEKIRQHKQITEITLDVISLLSKKKEKLGFVALYFYTVGKNYIDNFSYFNFF